MIFWHRTPQTAPFEDVETADDREWPNGAAEEEQGQAGRQPVLYDQDA
jgi:hypothetical protein